MNPLLLDLPMPIRTDRLQIRPWQVGEGRALHEAADETMEALAPWMPWTRPAPTVDSMEEFCRRSMANFLLRQDFQLSIRTPDGAEVIGSTGLHRPNWSVPSFHVGYWVRKKYQGQGLITESANALTRYAFALLGARRVEIRCDARNERSLAVMRRLGFRQEGVLRNNELATDGQLRDTIVTARTDIEGLPPLDVRW